MNMKSMGVSIKTPIIGVMYSYAGIGNIHLDQNQFKWACQTQVSLKNQYSYIVYIFANYTCIWEV